MELKVKTIHPNARIPDYAHEGDAGMDLRSAEETCIASGETKIVRTGIAMAIPEGYVGLVWDKSGYAIKHSLHTLAGVIDSTYRGEIGVVLRNLGEQVFKIEVGMKIAQLLVQPVVHAKLIEVEELDETTRGEEGFGSTGKH